MRCLITGATGFAGKHLTNLLREHGQEVFGACWPDQTQVVHCGLTLRSCDISDGQSLLDLVREAQPDRVYHLAGLTSAVDSLDNQRAVYKTNFFGTLNLLEAIRQAAPQARVVLIGSTQGYGTPHDAALPLTEQQPLEPRNPYAVSKAAADLLGFEFFAAHGLHVVRVRPANHTGPGQSPAFVCSDFARQIAAIALGKAKPELHVGNIDVSRDFSDVRDVVRAYMLLAEKGKAGEAYNVGSGRLVPLRQILDVLFSFCPVSVQMTVEPQRCRADDAKAIYVSIDKIRADTGWMPQYDLVSTLRDLYDYWITFLS